MGTESGLMLLDRSGQGKVYPLINRRRFQQMDVLEGLNVLVTISGNTHKETPGGSQQRRTHVKDDKVFISPFCFKVAGQHLKHVCIKEL